MTILQSDYNTQREHLRISEFGRHIQEYVSQIQSFPEKEKLMLTKNLSFGK